MSMISIHCEVSENKRLCEHYVTFLKHVVQKEFS